MKTLARLLTGVAVSAFLLTGANLALAQDKGKVTKAAAPAKPEKGQAKVTVVLESDKVIVREVAYKPGDDNKAVASSATRVLRVLKGGTITRTYADGKTEKIVYKDGEVRLLEPTKVGYSAKDTGKSDILLYIVQLK